MSASRERIASIRQRLNDLGRPDLRIIAVSKTHGPERIREMLDAGLRDFGENRQNEARDKFPLVDLSGLAPDALPVYHHIGPLQSGAARQIPGLFHWVHGASSFSALNSLHKAVRRFADDGSDASFLPLRYLIQVDLTGEASKAGGMAVDEVRNADAFPGDDVMIFSGFMAMGPEDQDPVRTREVFQRLRELRDEILPGGELSMGMSGDWELAVEEGATMIRIGTALFGTRGGGPWKKPE